MNLITEGQTLSDAIQQHRTWHQESKASIGNCLICTLLSESRWSDQIKHIGFDSINPISAGATLYIVRRPQIAFKGERLVIPSSLATYFQIYEIRIGHCSQLVEPSAIPAEIFGSPRIPEDWKFETIEVIDGDGIARGERFDMDLAQVSTDMAIGITNIDHAPHRFMASIIGRTPR